MFVDLSKLKLEQNEVVVLQCKQEQFFRCRKIYLMCDISFARKPIPSVNRRSSFTMVLQCTKANW